MKLLHVCNIEHENSNGISGIVPQYVYFQSKYEDVELLNLYANPKMDKNKKYDLIIIHGVYELNTLLFFYRFVYKRFNYVFVPHGGLTRISQKKSHLKKTFANRFIFRKFYEDAKAIQFLSENEKNNSIDVNNDSKIICSSGMTLPDHVMHIPQTHNSIVFTYIGRITIFYKGLDLLVKAVALAKDELIKNKVKINIIGINNDNEPLDELYRIIEKEELQDIVIIDLEGRFGEEKIKELLNADYFIQTSRSEGLPIGVLEALSLGMPLVTTDQVGFSDLIDKYKCGFHCNADVESISKMIIEAMHKVENVNEMSTNSYEAAKNYDWNTITRKTIDTYKELLYEG